MADSGTGEKTERATAKKRRDERKKGNVFSSKDIVSVASIIVMFFALRIWFPVIYDQLKRLFRLFTDYAADSEKLTMAFIESIYMDCVIIFAIAILPLLFLSMLVSIIAYGFQTKFLFAHEALKPKFNRLNPIEGFKRMVSLRSFVELIKNLVKITILIVIVYNFLVSRVMPMITTMHMGLEQSAVYILDSVIAMVISICIVFICVAMLDLVYQKWDYEKRLRMSKHEVKEEYKQLEGDPQVKRRIREVQMKMAMSRMMQAVPTADVVIKNPTHFAVALKYDIMKDMAPVLVAKGMDDLALRIIRVAEENGVYTTEEKELARALFSSVELNREISAEFYDTVAEILALLYKMKNKTI